MRIWIGVVAALLAVPTAYAQDKADGTYILQGGSYSINVRMENDNLIVVEPNKTSTYKRVADGSYQFTNDNNGVTYGLRIIDDGTIEAFKPGVEGNLPTRLVRLGGAPTNGPAPSTNESERWSALAGQYSDRISTDDSNSQSWAACAAVAMKRSIGSEDEANTYARQMATMLKQLDAVSSPCPDVIRATEW